MSEEKETVFIEYKENGILWHGIRLTKRSDAWVDFRIVEVCGWEDDNKDSPHTWGEGICDGDNSKDPDEATAWCEGFFKWDGCHEARIDYHVCHEAMWARIWRCIRFAAAKSMELYNVPQEEWDSGWSEP